MRKTRLHKPSIIGMLILLLTLVLIAYPALAQFGDLIGMGLSKIPGLDIGMKGDPPITTSFDDAVTSFTFLDEYPPERSFAACEMPLGPGNGYIVQPGTYQSELWSYCLHAGTYGPGQGNGYLYAPLKGKRAGIIQNMLNRTMTVDVKQQDVQALIWAILARTKFTEMGNEMKLVAAKLLTEKELLELQGGVLGLVPPEMWDKAFGELPPGVREIYEAEARLRDMFTTGYSSFEELERVAVLAGEPPRDEGPQIPSGRWSYHPDGYFVRYKPSGYSNMHMEMMYPHPCTVVRDTTGRVSTISDNRDYKLALEYDDAVAPAPIKDIKGLIAYKVKAITFTRPNLIRPWTTDETRYNGGGWVASSANVKASGKGDAALDGLSRFLKQQDGELAAVTKSAGIKTGKGSGNASVYLELASLVYATKQASSYAPLDPDDTDLWENKYVNDELDFSITDIMNLGKQPQTAKSEAAADAVRLAYDCALTELLAIMSINALPPAYPVPKVDSKEPKAPTCFPTWMQSSIIQSTPIFAGGRRLKEFNGGGVASPASRGRQRLAVSNRPRFDRDSDDDDEQPRPTRPRPNRPREEEPSPGKETFDRAKKVLGWASVVTFGMDVLTSGPGMAAANQIGSGIPGAGADAIINFNMDTAETISKSLGGDPPDSNYKVVDEVTVLNPTPVAPAAGIPPARTEALNRILTASCQVTAYGKAAMASLDRHGGALLAGDAEWIYIQRDEIVKHKRSTGFAMLLLADAFEQYIAELKSEGVLDMIVTPDHTRRYQNRLRTTGWTSEEREAARLLGISDAKLEEMKQERLAADPNLSSGSFFQKSAEIIAVYREMGVYLMMLPNLDYPTGG